MAFKGWGARGYINGARELNVRDTKLYVRKALQAGEPVTAFQPRGTSPRAAGPSETTGRTQLHAA